MTAAKNRGLDFIALTDHNSVSQNATAVVLQNYFDSLLLIPGREVTTFYGHANVYGTTEFIDFRLQEGSAKNGDYLLQQVEDLSALISVNHPGSPSGENCMGCGWVLDDTDFKRIPAIEVVNGGYVERSTGQAHIDFWQQQLNAGNRITGIGGSDSHLADRESSQPSAIGNPTTWVFANDLSVASILEGIRSGKVFIEVASGSGRLLLFTVNGTDMGGEVGVAGKVEFELQWESSQLLIPRWIHQGETIDLQSTVLSKSSIKAEIDAGKLTLPGWIRVDLVDEQGNIKILGNPVYLRAL